MACGLISLKSTKYRFLTFLQETSQLKCILIKTYHHYHIGLPWKADLYNEHFNIIKVFDTLKQWNKLGVKKYGSLFCMSYVKVKISTVENWYVNLQICTREKRNTNFQLLLSSLFSFSLWGTFLWREWFDCRLHRCDATAVHLWMQCNSRMQWHSSRDLIWLSHSKKGSKSFQSCSYGWHYDVSIVLKCWLPKPHFKKSEI